MAKKKVNPKEKLPTENLGADADQSSDDETIFPNLNRDNDLIGGNDGESDAYDDDFVRDNPLMSK